MDPPFDRDAFFDAETITHSPLPQSVIFVVKTLTTGETNKYCVHCDPKATLSVLRDTLHSDEDKIMSADDRFHKGDFRVGKSAELHIQWRTILQDNIIGIMPKNFNPSSTLAVGNSPSTSAKRRFGAHPSSSSFFPPATVPLHRLTKGGGAGGAARLYGDFANEKGSDGHSGLWTYDELVCRIWEGQEAGMVPLRRLYSPKSQVWVFTASDEATNWWVEKEGAKVEFIVGYVYRSDGPCPEGAVPFYGVDERRIGRLLTLSESERDSCLQLGARDLGIQCYVAPP